MTVSAPIRSALSRGFNNAARALRKVRRARRYNRTSAAKALRDGMERYWQAGTEVLFSTLDRADAWSKIQQRTQLRATRFFREYLSKSLSDSDRELLNGLLAKFNYFDDVAKIANQVVRERHFETFSDAATFALKQLGVAEPNFELKNERVKDFLLGRREAVVHATRNHVDRVYETIVNNFYDLGSNPYDRDFISQLQKDLRYQTGWEAKRFALTETGIVAEQAQVETYRRNGVERKQWNATGNNTRDSHLKLHGAVIGIDRKFNVGGNPADHPLDASLPPAELVNCHCWLSPVVDDDFELNPENVWEGQ